MLTCMLSATALTGCGSLGDSATANKWQHKKHSKHPIIRHNASTAVLTQRANPNPTGNLWTTLPRGFQIEFDESNPNIQAQIQWFMQHQAFLERMTQRAAPYLYMIYDQVKQRDLPTELVLLPIIESAYYPFAYSIAGAAGIWQLMPGTASKFGIKRDSWYDGRRDIFASTTAALDYLDYLGNYFNGDWALAIAAYDAGEGTIQSAIRHNSRENLPTDFWSLPLSAETRAYVPRLLALVVILKHPDRYPVNMPAINDQPYLGQVDVGSQIKLKDAARIAGISLEQLKTLNPGYKRLSTDPQGVHKLLLPLEKIDDFKTSLGLSSQPNNINWNHYRVQAGDTWSSLASRFHISIARLKQLNNIDINSELNAGSFIQIPNSNNLDEGTAAKVTDTDNITNLPGTNLPKTAQLNNDDNDDESATDETEDTSEKPPATKQWHLIKAHETLSSIARRYKVTVRDLQNWNHLSPNMPLKINAKLVIYKIAKLNSPAQSTVAPLHSTTVKTTSVTKPSNKLYHVQAGDTLNHIAHRFNLTVAQLKAANPQINPAKLKPGQVIIIR